MALVCRTASGRTVRLGGLLGQGGEGAVYECVGAPDLAAKLYKSALSESRRQKVVSMTDALHCRSSDFVAFPIEALFSGGDTFAGFTMKRVGGYKPVHQLYSPTSRKTEFPGAGYDLLLRTAENIARAVASVHELGCVIGDINHSGVLTAKDGTVTLIDSDSFQFRHKGQTFPCKVGVPEFTPPELQGKPLDNVIRQQNHDAFGLAVLVFYTLFMGRHPFAGRFKGAGEMPMEKAIAEFRFAYSKRSDTLIAPPPHVPLLSDVPIAVADAFERAFGPSGATFQAGRPDAAHWAAILRQAEGQLVGCPRSRAHRYFKVSADCPWCRMEAAVPGFLAFTPTPDGFASPSGQPLNVAQLIATLQGVPDPGPAPGLDGCMVASGPATQSAGARETWRLRRVRQYAGTACLAIAAVAAAAAHAPAVTLAAVALGAMLLAVPGRGVRDLIDAKARAARAWDLASEAFAKAAGNGEFLSLRARAEAVVRRLDALKSEEATRIGELGAKRRDGQLRRYLEKFSVDFMRVKGVGGAKKAMLKSYGIESAADVEATRIMAISGFGPTTASAIGRWRTDIESKFVFNPNEPVNARDVAAIRTDVVRRRNEGESEFKQLMGLLQADQARVRALRAQPDGGSAALWAALRQAEADARPAASLGGGVGRMIFAGTGLAVALIWLFLPSRDPARSTAPPAAVLQAAPIASPPPPAERKSAVAPPIASPPAPERREPAVAPPIARLAPPPTKPDQSEAAAIAVPSTPEGVPPTAAPARPAEPLLDLLSLADASRVQQRLAALGFFSGIADGVWGPRSRFALREFRWAQGIGSDDHWDEETQSAMFSGSARAADASRPDAPEMAETRLPPPEGATRNPLNRGDALWVQNRLKDLGYYGSISEGVWGPASRDALRSFKEMNGLPHDDAWDAETERRLGAASQVTADQTFVGRWVPTGVACPAGPGGTPPVSITAKGAASEGGACDFETVTRDGPGKWRVQGHCVVGDRKWDANINLKLSGGNLSWTSEKGATVYRRCPPAAQ